MTLGASARLASSVRQKAKYVVVTLQGQAGVVERDDGVGEGRGELLMWRRSRARSRGRPPGRARRRCAKPRPPGGVDGVVALAEVAHAAHVGELQVLVDDLLGVRLGQVHLGHEAVGMAQAVGEGLHPA